MVVHQDVQCDNEAAARRTPTRGGSMTRLASSDVNIAQTLARRMPPATPATLEHDRELADTRPELERRLAAARERLTDAYRTPAGAADTQRRVLAVTIAYNALIEANEAAYRVAVGPTVKRSWLRKAKGRHSPEAGAALVRLEEARRAKEQHLLHASAAVRVPNSLQTSSHAAYGPHGAGLHFDPVPPLGPRATRQYGVDMDRTLDAEARATALPTVD
jgi:hypothetical protein